MRLFHYMLAISLCATLFGCAKEEDIISTDTQVGHSKIVYFPEIAIKGERLIILKQGGTYTDAGANATLNNQTTTFSTVGSVDVSKPGVYDITYEAKNEQGFSATDWRTVVVIGPDVSSNNFSGTYLRAATGVTCTWKKTADGVYEVDNPGGAASGVGYKVVVVNYQGNKIKMPRQLAVDPSSGSTGAVSSTTETYNAAASPVTFSWIFLAGGYGTGLRTFTKQ
jgi:hypothetical protein